jgi:hypothetical protein
MKTAFYSAAFLTCGAIASFADAAVISTHAADGTVNTGGGINLTAIEAQVGRRAGNERSAVLPFLMPTLPAGEVFDTADLRTMLNHNNALAGQRGDLYGLSRVDASPTILAADFYLGALDASASLIQNDIYSNSTPLLTAVNTNATADALLVSFLNTKYAGGANAGKYFFLRFSSDLVTTGDDRFQVLTSEAGSATERPLITYTSAAVVVPEPTSLVAISAIAATGLMRRSRRL